MPMPKGHVVAHGYSTRKALGGDSYQDISVKMTEIGYKMNHSTARNIFVDALRKVAKEMVSLYDIDCEDKDLTTIARNPNFQDAIIEFMREGMNDRIVK